MNLTVVAIIMVAAVIAFAFAKKVPMQFILCVVPVICGLLAGFNIGEVGEMAMGQITKSMQSAGIMCLFAMVYFTMLSETGMFNIVIRRILRLTKGRVSIYMIMIITSVISGIGFLTAQVVTAYSIVFPAMLPLYKKIQFNKASAMVIAQTSIAAMGFIPWGIAVVNSSVFANVDAMELSRRLMPVSACFIPFIILQWVYFGYKQKKQGLPMTVEWTDDMGEDKDEKGFSRPKLFWFNFLLFLMVITALVTAVVPSYLVFVIAAFLTLLVNYPEPKVYQKLLNQAGGRFFNTLMMLIGISVFLGVFNESGMVKALATFVVSVFPQILTRYIHIILAAIMVLVIRFMPNKIYNSMYPALISVGAKFGLTGVDVIAPFVCNMSLGTGASPFTATTHVGTALLDIEMDDYCRQAVPVLEITNVLIIALALLVGVVR